MRHVVYFLVGVVVFLGIPALLYFPIVWFSEWAWRSGTLGFVVVIAMLLVFGLADIVYEVGRRVALTVIGTTGKTKP